MYANTDPNLLTFNPGDGGLPGFAGWLHPDGSAAAGNGDLTFTLPEDTGITTAAHPAGVAVSRLKTQPGATYTAAVTCTRLVVVALRWVMDDGNVSAPALGYGTRRAAVTATCPPNATSVIVELFAPTARVTGTAATTAQVTFWSDVEVGPFAFLADDEDPAPVLLSGVVLVRGRTDPGPLPPTIVDTTFGQRLWASLPQLYLDYDAADTATGLPLSKFLHGLYDQVDQVEALRDSIAAGALSDPLVIPDRWLGWVSQMVGSPVTTTDAMRALLAAMPTAPAPGSRPALVAAGAQFLTGSRVCNVFPSTSKPWTISVRVRADELGTVGGTTAGFSAALRGTGQVPAGYDLFVYSGLPTWGAVETAAAGTWGGLTTGRPFWADVDSIGITGV
jgi:hypothetical protein